MVNLRVRQHGSGDSGIYLVEYQDKYSGKWYHISPDFAGRLDAFCCAKEFGNIVNDTGYPVLITVYGVL